MDTQVTAVTADQKLRQRLIDNEVKILAARDREVRAHEQAHVAAGGQFAGAPVYKFERGPNGVNYAVGGEVSISTSKEADPAATLRKAQIIRRAALAPAEPSPQDRQVAAMATRLEAEARNEITLARTGKAETTGAEGDDPAVPAEATPTVAEPAEAKTARHDPTARLRQQLFTPDKAESNVGTLFSRIA